jgi:hypothetical protein
MLAACASAWHDQTMNLILNIPETLAARLAAAGADPEHLALLALQQAANELERLQQAGAPKAPHRTPSDAASRMRASRLGNVLPEGVSIRDLMTHGRA